MRSGRQLIDDIRDAVVQDGRMAAWWLGQHSFAVKQESTLLWLDPFLTDVKGRRSPGLLAPTDIPAGSIVLGSHDHADHIDRPAWERIARAGTEVTFVVPEKHREALLRETGIARERTIGLDDMRQAIIGRATVTGVAAAHEFLDRDPESGLHPYLGFVIEVGGMTLYHAGDTCIYEGLQAKLRKWRFDIVFLPINGRDARRLRRGCIGNMTYQEAADLAGVLRGRVTVPAHFDMFEGNREDPELFIDYMAVKYPDLRTALPEYGARIDIS